MNKKVILSLIPVMMLTACNKAVYKLDVQVASPAGSPAIALYKYLGDTEHLEVNTDANNVIAYFTSTETSQRKDIILAPTNAGIAAINKGAEYKIAATVTFGNFFLISTGLDEDKILNEGDKVLAFQQNGVAGKLFNYLYGDKGLDVTYANSAADVKNTVLTDKSFNADYVLLAQPVVNAVVSAKEGYSVFANLQNDYKEKADGKEITQASIFVRNDSDKKAVDKFLSNVESDVKALLDNPDTFLDAIKDLDETIVTGKVTAKKEAVVNLLKNDNALGLGYKEALQNKASIDAFIQTLGLKESNEKIYYSFNK